MKRIFLATIISLSVLTGGCSSSNHKIYTPYDKAMQYSEVFIPIKSENNQEYHRVMNFGDFQIIQTFKNNQQVYIPDSDNIQKPDNVQVLAYSYSKYGTAAVLYSFDLLKAKQTIGDSKQYFTYVDHQINKRKQITDQIVGLPIIQTTTNKVVQNEYKRNRKLFNDPSKKINADIQKELNKQYPGVFTIQDFKFFH